MKFSLEPAGRFQLTSLAHEGALCFPDECKHPLPRFATAIAFGHNTYLSQPHWILQTLSLPTSMP